MQLDIVSAEEAIFSGKIQRVTVSGQEGELGIHPGHTALLTAVKPGNVVVVTESSEHEVFYVSGGMLEVQPQCATILADTVIRADEIDELAAEEALKKAEESFGTVNRKDADYARMLSELTQAQARLNAVKNLSQYVKRKHTS